LLYEVHTKGRLFRFSYRGEELLGSHKVAAHHKFKHENAAVVCVVLLRKSPEFANNFALAAWKHVVIQFLKRSFFSWLKHTGHTVQEEDMRRIIWSSQGLEGQFLLPFSCSWLFELLAGFCHHCTSPVVLAVDRDNARLPLSYVLLQNSHLPSRVVLRVLQRAEHVRGPDLALTLRVLDDASLRRAKSLNHEVDYAVVVPADWRL
jgi:hypothetical protein